MLVELSTLNLQPDRWEPIPYHTSILSGHQWVLRLIAGHPDHIWLELGVWKEIFLQLLLELCQAGHCDSRRVTLEEQVTIFLYTCVTGLMMHYVVKCFQCSGNMISWWVLGYFFIHLTDPFNSYFKKTLDILAAPPFYTTYIHFPVNNTIPSKIQCNLKFYLYFHNTISAIDGFHISATPSGHLCLPYHNHKGFLSQNMLFVFNFNLKFMYTLTGWEGLAIDVQVYNDIAATDLHIPAGKYLLANGGYTHSRCYMKVTLWLNEGNKDISFEGGAHEEMQCPQENIDKSSGDLGYSRTRGDLDVTRHLVLHRISMKKTDTLAAGYKYYGMHHHGIWWKVVEHMTKEDM